MEKTNNEVNFCPSCGAVCKRGARFCERCGERLGNGGAQYASAPQAPTPAYQYAPAPQASPAKPKKSRVGLFIALGALALVATVAVALIAISSSRVKAVMQAIDAIGTVGMDSAAAIDSAAESYGALSEGLKKKVVNFGALHEASEKYAALVREVEESMLLIEGIGAVDIESGDAIKEAREAYEALSSDQKESVSNYAALIDAEAQYQTAVENAECEGVLALIDGGEYAAAEAGIYAFLEKYPASLRAEELAAALPAVREGQAAEYIERARDMIASGELDQATEALDICARDFAECKSANECAALYAELDTARVKLASEQAADFIDAGDLEAGYLLLEGVISEYPYVEATADAVDMMAALQKKLDKLRPKTGAKLHSSISSGKGTMEFETEAGTDYLIKIESTSDAEDYILLYIRGGDKKRINIHDGVYIVKYASGSTWYGEEYRFGRSTSYTLAEDTFDFKTTSDSQYIYYSRWTITLYTVVGGNLETRDISENAF